MYHRRHVLKMIGTAPASFAVGGVLHKLAAKGVKKHIVTLSFDDGFKKSSIRTAEIFEKHKFSACINVIATGHLPDFKVPDEYHVTEKGDFLLWNELQARGHEIMPHGYKHANKANMPLPQAKELISNCLDYFTQQLKGFDRKKAIFNFPYNASTPELESWIANEVLAFRTGGPTINAMPHNGQKKLTCGAYGPGSTEKDLEVQIETLLKKPSGWLLYNTHGLDGEGWGPMSATFLDDLLGRLKKIESVAVLPAGKALVSFA